ncbi:MAG: hydrogenase nickel incorporation protein HypA [Candidatus Thermoplasmatota archaeon]
MHEWALAESIISASVEAAEKEDLKKITVINVSLGELQQINREIFKKAVSDIIDTKNSIILEEAKIKVKTEKTLLECNKCSYEWGFDEIKKNLSDDDSESIHFIPEVAFVHTRCPNCGSPDFEITKGRGVTIPSIKGEK